jgi:hypothetical protein
MTWTTYRIRARKARTGELIEGTTEWDGLASLYTVKRDDGTTAYVTVLDDIELFEVQR